jgi:PAS domain S-box-containing protein
MSTFLRYLDWLGPRKLTARLTLATVIIVILAGAITLGTVNQVLLWNLRTELMNSGEALAQSLGESLANSLVDGNLVSIQEALDTAVQNSPDVLYAYAYAPNIPVIHSFPKGFPADLRSVTSEYEDESTSVLLRTEWGLVRDFRYLPLDGLPVEVHLGLSQARIEAVQRQVTGIILALTVFGCLAAAGVTYGFSYLATRPLRELTRGVQRLGDGHLDERINLPRGDEVGDLALAFNRMAAEIQRAIEQLRASEKGYRDLLTAASAVGEGIALICNEGPEEGTFMFVNEAFAHLAGFAPADLIHLNAATVLHPESIQVTREAWNSIRQGKGQEPLEITLVDRHGQSHILETSGTLVKYQGKEALAWFTRDISARKAREDELRRLWEELREKEHVRRELLGRVIGAQEDERQRIARELHDGIGQSLNALVFGLNTISTALVEEPQMVSKLVERIKISASDTVKELQTIIYDLRPSLLDDLGLVRALSWYAEERLRARGIHVKLEIPDDVQRLSPKVETALFRIAQEAITNICKYARACETHIHLKVHSDRVQMEIADDGIGFDACKALAGDSGRYGWGLLGIRERAELLGGELLVDSQPESGTRLVVTIPTEVDER